MATYERTGLMTYIDESGNKYILYPITKVAAVDGAVSKVEASVTLYTSGWSNLRQSRPVPGVTANNTVIVTPAPESYIACLEAGAYCSGQGAGTLSFGCIKAPSGDIAFNILILD